MISDVSRYTVYLEQSAKFDMTNIYLFWAVIDEQNTSNYKHVLIFLNLFLFTYFITPFFNKML